MFQLHRVRQSARPSAPGPDRTGDSDLSGSRSPRLLAKRIIYAMIVWLLTAPALRAQLGEGRAVPRQVYFFAFEPFYRGEYRDGLKGFRSAAANGINTGAGRWVDSICYFTMTGECLYHLGDLAGALDQYDAALQLVVMHSRNKWLQYLQLPPTIGPMASNARINWGPSTRNAVPGAYPDTILSMRGTNLDAALRRGGPVVAPELYPVRAVEVMRCAALALRRRRELLGPIAPQIPLTQDVVRRLSTVQVPPNHWMQTLIDVQLGIARAAAGDHDEAMGLLQRSLTIAGQFDHPLTAIALLEIGDLARQKNDLELAQRSYFEASFAAANYRQADALEEAMVGAAELHLIRNQPGIFAPLTAAAEWCRVEDLDRAAAAMWISAAEQTTIAGDARQAARLLSQARSAMGRSDLRGADLGVRMAFQTALLAFDEGDEANGYKALGDTFRLHKNHSRRSFQLELTNRFYAANEISPRIAGALFEYLLREPTAEDWQRDRLEVQYLESTPHLPLLERWLSTIFERGTVGDFDTLVLASEMIRRHKFFSRLPLAGRLLALRWVLEAPEVLLDDEARNQRQNLLTKYPELSANSRQIAELKARLIQMPVVSEASEEAKTYERAAQDLVQAADSAEQQLWRIALRPDPAQRMFPPLLPLDQIRRRLRDGQAILSFVENGNDMYALLLAPNGRQTTWMVNTPAKLRSQLPDLMREIGNFDSKQVLPADRLLSEDWKEISAELWDSIAAGLSSEVLATIQELVIVPDGYLWYLPFEMLQVSVGNDRKPLIDLVPIRYAPTLGLAVQDARPKQSSGPRVIVHGRLFSRDNNNVLASAADQLKGQQNQGVVLRRRLPVATQYVASVWQLLVVLDDIEGVEKDALSWSPAQVDQGKRGGALSDWLALPWGAPDIVVLPGYRTAAESGLRGRQQGDELLITTCGMMAAGVRTIVISRWRTAGRSSMELLREFLQELPVQTAANAWQRSVLLTRSSELDPAAEPRLKDARPGEIPMGDHPFFWAGYLMMGAW